MNDSIMTMQDQAEELVEAFEMFDDADGKYQFLIDLGRKLPPMDAADKTEETRVHGCQSNVWVVAQVHHDAGKQSIDIIADSDAQITKGVIAVLQKVYSGHSPEEILSFDIDTFLERVGLNHILSMGRRNGLYGMVQRIKTLAATNA
jgi:sulfur transfer protein SufE